MIETAPYLPGFEGEQRRRKPYERHGHSPDARASRTYVTWASMLDRCTNPKSTRWKYYGARGITVCERWAQSFVAFLEDVGERPKGKTLDREDPNGNYEPGNCRWVDHKTQCRNRRNGKLKADDIPEIKALRAQGLSYAAIGARYDVDKQLIYQVVKGKIWK